MKNTIQVLGAAFIGGLLSLGAFNLWNPNQENSVVYVPQEVTTPATFVNNANKSAYVDLSLAAEEVVTEVVHVKTRKEGQEYVQLDPYSFFYGSPQGRKYKAPDQKGSGSGVVIREDGYIVTNNHVIEGADEVDVVFSNNKSYHAKVVGADPSTDLALLKIEAQDLSPIRLGNSDDLKLGQWVLAVGNPYNLNSTVTAGIVSAKARNINILQRNSKTPPLEAFIQTDAAVNPGNSGGALVNASGELVGINSAIQSPTGSYSGYSFAIPVNIMKKVVNDIMEYGVVQRAFIGVSITNVTSELAEKADLSTLTGVYVNGLSPDGAAQKAGVEKGDVITAVNGNKVKNVAELQEQIGLFLPGDEVAVEVERKQKSKLFTLKLRNNKGTTDLVEAAPKALATLGANLVAIDTDLQKRLKISHGVQVQQLAPGKLAKAGIREGFIITRIDGKPVADAKEVSEVLNAKNGGVLVEGVYPNGVKKYYGVAM